MDVHQYRRLAERWQRRILVLFMLWHVSMVNREICFHPLNLQCENKGEFYSLYPDLCNFCKEFFSMYRLTPTKFDALLRLLEPRLKGTHMNMRKPISAEQKLVITMR